MTSRIRLKLALGAAVSAAALAPGAAQGALLVPSAPDCAPQTATTPFTPWLDLGRYVPVHDSGFESGADGWTGTGATAVTGNEPWRVRAAGDSHSLTIDGGRATTPPMCVGVAHPTLRFFARNAGSPTGTLAVSVLFKTTLGTSHELPIGAVATPGERWAPTLPMPVVANLLTLLPGERTTVRFRFRALGLGSAWGIDDVYVDPYSKR
jgi:hypothetical protein